MTVLVVTVGTSPLPVYYAIQTHARRQRLSRVVLVCSGPQDPNFTTLNRTQPELAYGTRRYAEAIRAVLYRQAHQGVPWEVERDPVTREKFLVKVVPFGPRPDVAAVTEALAGADLPDEPVILDYTGGTATMIAAAMTWYDTLGPCRGGRSYVDATHQVLRYRPESPGGGEERLLLPVDDSLEVIAHLHGYDLTDRGDLGKTLEAVDLEKRTYEALRQGMTAHDAESCPHCPALGLGAHPTGGAHFEVRRAIAARPVLNGYRDYIGQSDLCEFDVVARWGRSVVAVECKVSAGRFTTEAGWAIRSTTHVFGPAAVTGLVYRREDGVNGADLRVVTAGLQQITGRAVWRQREDMLGRSRLHPAIAPPAQPFSSTSETRTFVPSPGPSVVSALGTAPLAAVHAIHASADIAEPGQPRYVCIVRSHQGADVNDAARLKGVVAGEQGVSLTRPVTVDLTDEDSIHVAALGAAPTDAPVVFDGTAGTKAATIGLLRAHRDRELAGGDSRFRVADVRTREVTTLRNGELTVHPLELARVPWPVVIGDYARCIDGDALRADPRRWPGWGGLVLDAVAAQVPEVSTAQVRWWRDWSLPLIRVAAAQVVAMTAWDRIVFLVCPTDDYPGGMRDPEANGCYVIERVALQIDTAAAHVFGDAAVTVVANPWQQWNDRNAHHAFLDRLRSRYDHGGPLYLLARPGRRIDLIIDPTDAAAGLHSVRAAFAGTEGIV